MTPQPPKYALMFLRWFCRDEYLEEFEGDLVEFFEEEYPHTPLRAQWRFTLGVMRHFRPLFLKSFASTLIYSPMLRHHLKISYRTLWKNKGSSLINIGGLAVGMAVFILIGFWLRDELTFNTYHQNSHRIARVMQHRTVGDQTQTWYSSMLPLADALREEYGSDFERVVRSSFLRERIFYYQEQGFTRKGYYTEAEGPVMLSLDMLKGDINGLTDPASVFISNSFAQAVFGDENPIGKVLSLSLKYDLKVAGVYADIPANSTYGGIGFFTTWHQFLLENTWIENMNNPWGSSSFLTHVQLTPQADVDQINAKIKDLILENTAHDQAALNSKPVCFIHPMDRWKLYSRFENGVNTGGFIETVRLFGFIALFVLLLACFNFVNLSTARSEKRAKEVGVRKAIGSYRRQLMGQFYTEAILVAFVAMVCSLLLVYLAFPAFNDIANKEMQIDWTNPLLYLLTIGFVLLIGLLAGSYPALFLSAFKPVEVLKGSFQTGPRASIPRKILVLTQFAISTALIIGTMTVYQQIQYGLDRPLGYDQGNLVTVYSKLADIRQHFPLIKHELEQNKWVESMAKSSSPLTNVYGTRGSWDWRGKDPNQGVDFPFNIVSADFGKTVGWELQAGRDFSADLKADSASLILNEAAAAFMGFENPIGEMVTMDDEEFQVIGIVKNLLVESPFAPIRPSVFSMEANYGSIMTIKLNPQLAVDASLKKVEEVVKQHDPNAILDFSFVDDAFGAKFDAQKRVRDLSTIFGFLAILISCLGLFGLAAYMAERRSKEVSIRKVLGATVMNLWSLLSRDFLLLVGASFLVAIPVAWYVLQGWLEKYPYRIELSWEVCLIASALVLGISLLTISYQTLRTALANPVKALKEE